MKNELDLSPLQPSIDQVLASAKRLLKAAPPGPLYMDGEEQIEQELDESSREVVLKGALGLPEMSGLRSAYVIRTHPAPNPLCSGGLRRGVFVAQVLVDYGLDPWRSGSGYSPYSNREQDRGKGPDLARLFAASPYLIGQLVEQVERLRSRVAELETR